MREIGRYDPDLEMFVETPKPVNTNRLVFERWLVQSGRGEHYPASVPCGDLALALVIREGLPIEQALRSMYRKTKDGTTNTD